MIDLIITGVGYGSYGSHDYYGSHVNNDNSVQLREIAKLVGTIDNNDIQTGHKVGKNKPQQIANTRAYSEPTTYTIQIANLNNVYVLNDNNILMLGRLLQLSNQYL